MQFRFILQPTMAAILGVRAGLVDATTGCRPPIWGLLSGRAVSKRHLEIALRHLAVPIHSGRARCGRAIHDVPAHPSTGRSDRRHGVDGAAPPWPEGSPTGSDAIRRVRAAASKHGVRPIPIWTPIASSRNAERRMTMLVPDGCEFSPACRRSGSTPGPVVQPEPFPGTHRPGRDC
jgi:hypothetical protein